MRLHIAVSFCGVEHLGNSGYMFLFFLSLYCLLVFSDQLKAPVGPTPPRKVSLVESMGQEVHPALANLSNCSLPVGAALFPCRFPSPEQLVTQWEHWWAWHWEYRSLPLLYMVFRVQKETT